MKISLSFFCSLVFSIFCILSLSSCASDKSQAPAYPDDFEETNNTTLVASSATLEEERVAAEKEQKIIEEKAAQLEAAAKAKVDKEEAALKAKIEEEERQAAAKLKKEKEAQERRRKRRAKRKAEAERKKAAQAKAEAMKEDVSGIDEDLLDIVSVKNKKGDPVIYFGNPSFNFGRIQQGKEIDHEFIFTNKGSAPLVISDVKATCGCTTPFYPFVPIEPGKTGKISVHFNSKGRLGNQKPVITVFSNAKNPKVELTLEGIIDTDRADDKKE